jgi:phage gp16-like protein
MVKELVMITVYQDGDCFYSTEHGLIYTAKIKVKDLDMESALKAREEFKQYCKESGLVIQFQHHSSRLNDK